MRAPEAIRFPRYRSHSLTFRCGAAILRQLYLERWAMTLSSTLVRSNSLGAKALMVLGGSLFIAAAAQVTVPMYPVPVTLQTLAVLAEWS